MLALFISLQILDLASTLLWLYMGGHEGNGLAVWIAMHLAGNLPLGLIYLKLVAIACGYGMWRKKQRVFFYLCNTLFTGVVAWNLYWLCRSLIAY